MVAEVPNIDGLVWLGYLTHVSEDISAPNTRINLLIAALEPSCKVPNLQQKLKCWFSLFT